MTSTDTIARDRSQSVAVEASPVCTPTERLARRAHELTFHLPMLAVLAVAVRCYLQPAQEEEEGQVAEWVIGIAIMATLALAVGAIIVTKVTAKANSIDLG